ncbi:hypothetical protein FKM82_015928 [Ascaphus truei]
MELASAVFNGIILLLVALGVRDVFFVYESNRCSMTYMFEYPEYQGQDFSPQSVAIIGHSMGGLVAKALLTLKNFKPELINLIITQATPHVAPVLPADHYLTDFYALVNNYWILNAYELRNITTLSVAGGYRDYQIRSGLTFLPGSNLHNSALSVVVKYLYSNPLIKNKTQDE